MSKSVYLIVSHVTRLAAGVDASKKGVSSNPDNYETFENMIISDKVGRRHSTEASVIIDLLGGKVLKNRFDLTSTEVFKEYVDRYQEDVTAALKQWVANDVKNYDRLKGLVPGDKNETNSN